MRCVALAPENEAGAARIGAAIEHAAGDFDDGGGGRIAPVAGEGDMVAIYCTLHARHTGELMGVPATNRPVAFRQVHLIRFEDGKGIEHWAVRDDLSLMRQLSVVSSPSRYELIARAVVPA